MLPTAAAFAQTILTLSPTTSASAGMASVSGLIGGFMAEAQGGPTGSPGIFTLNDAALGAALAALPQVADASWVFGFADAMEAAILASMITPGTVSNPAWTTSGVDVATIPSAAATITTIAAAKAALIAGLQLATATNNPPVPFAQAMRDCTLAFIFTCIGLGPFGAPIPIPTPAE